MTAARVAPLSAADLTESMMGTYGHRVPVDVIARLVHGVLDSHAHPLGEPVPLALSRKVDRRLRNQVYADDPGSRPVRSARAEAIAEALRRRRA